MGGVLLYCATSRTTGKMYAGITGGSSEGRWGEHVRESRRDRSRNVKFAKAIRKHGPEDFEIITLHEYASWEEACHAEIELIHHLELIKYGYNSLRGGDLPPMLTPEAAQKCADARRGRKLPPRSAEWRANLSKALKGRIFTEEWRAKMSAAKKGRPLLPHVVARAAAARTGRPVSDETREKIAAAQRGVKRRPLTAEEKARVAAAVRASWARRRAANESSLVH